LSDYLERSEGFDPGTRFSKDETQTQPQHSQAVTGHPGGDSQIGVVNEVFDVLNLLHVGISVLLIQFA
jgi:hypothetical protein